MPSRRYDRLDRLEVSLSRRRPPTGALRTSDTEYGPFSWRAPIDMSAVFANPLVLLRGRWPDAVGGETPIQGKRELLCNVGIDRLQIVDARDEATVRAHRAPSTTALKLVQRGAEGMPLVCAPPRDDIGVHRDGGWVMFVVFYNVPPCMELDELRRQVHPSLVRYVAPRTMWICDEVRDGPLELVTAPWALPCRHAVATRSLFPIGQVDIRSVVPIAKGFAYPWPSRLEQRVESAGQLPSV